MLYPSWEKKSNWKKRKRNNDSLFIDRFQNMFWRFPYPMVNVIYIIHSIKEYIYNGLGSALSYRHYSVSFMCIYHLFLHPHNMQMYFIFLEEKTFISPCPSLFRKSIVFSIKAELLWSWDPLVVHYLIYR